jgi:glucose-6-phosphate 1-epimerase
MVYHHDARLNLTPTAESDHMTTNQLIDALNAQHALAGQVTIAAGEACLPVIQVHNRFADAHIYLHGAHITHFQPHGESPLIWLSKSSRFQAGSAIRGGIPICWPWFGPHATTATFPAHGFARTSTWTLIKTTAEKDGSTTIELELRDTEQTRTWWPHPFILRYRVHVGTILTVELITHNVDNKPCSYQEALHSYFPVSSIHTISVTGLDHAFYIDKVAGGTRHQQHGPVTFHGETDRVYLDTREPCAIVDTNRAILIEKNGSLSTVVWNPWSAKAKAMSDFGDQEWPDMVCVESANALTNTITLAPGASHTLQVRISVPRT